MFYLLSKTVSYLLTPAGWLIATLGWAWFTKSPVRRRRLVGVSLALFWVLGNGWLVNEAVRGWELEPALLDMGADSTVAASTVAVVLTGGIMSVNRTPLPGQPLLGTQADRAGQALYLYKTGAVQKILISGGSGTLPFVAQSLSDEGELTERFLRLAGVRAEDIWREGKSRNTYENALFSAPILRKRYRTNRCVLVTSALHMRRAVACFRKQGIRPIPFPGAFIGQERPLSPAQALLPNEQSLADAYFLLRELVGYVSYRVVGYL